VASAAEPSPARLLPCGETALLVELAGTAAAVALTGRIESLRAAGRAPWVDVADIVTGERTVLVVGAHAGFIAKARAALLELACTTTLPDAAGGDGQQSAPLVEIPVVYDGPDLLAVAAHTGLSPRNVVAAHVGTEWKVGFTGFAPGFAYLIGGDPRLAVPRLVEPRPRVTAGSVALAGPYSGIYPTDSPGGWHLIGHTDLTLWDLHRDPPAALRPGMRVRFRDAAGTS
jgi:KipI family sensor histidine kinase inhibitor